MHSGDAQNTRPRARLRRWCAWVGGLGLLAGSALPAQAQAPIPGGHYCPPPNYPAPGVLPPAVPGTIAPVTPGQPGQAGQPGQGGQPGQTGQPGQPGQTGQTGQTNPAETAAPETPAPAEASLAGGSETVATGYIDQAIPVTQFRLRYDASYGDNRPDRAGFFYAQCGCFPGAPGPRLPETKIDYQDVSAYLEIAVDNRLSGFVEVPVRFLNPEQNENTTGVADMNAGFKYALIASREQYLTFQLRTYIPTGDAGHGLGTDIVSLEPALLYHRHLTDSLVLDTELRDWIPLDTNHGWNGNVVRYGAGLSYLLVDNPRFRVIPVGEIVGWTVLNGKEFAVTSVNPPAGEVGSAEQDAGGDTIVNAKVGVRFGFGSAEDQGFLSKSDLYVGYGRALTGDVWYKDILRVEYRILF